MLKKLLYIPAKVTDDTLFQKMVNWSVLLHALVFIVMGFKAFVFPTEPLDMDAAIRVDIVDLPDKITQMPEEPGPQPEPVKKVEVKPPTEEVKPSKEPPKPAPIALKQKPKEKEALKKIEEFRKEEDKRRRMEEIRKQVEQEEAKDRAEKRVKAMALLKGNAVNPGSALQGLRKAEFNEYVSQLRNHMREHWSLPEWLQNDSLRTIVVVYIDQRGQIIKRVVEKSSGDARFDDFALKAVDEASPFPRPPEKFVDLVRVDGIVLGFPQ